MASSEESRAIPRHMLGFPEESRREGERDSAGAASRAGLWSRLLRHEWSAAGLYLFLDVVSWLAIYRVAGWFRYDAFYATPFQFFIVNLIQLGVIVAALYFVGGYDLTVQKLTLGYAAEHTLASIAAAEVRPKLIYCEGTFYLMMHP